MIKCIIADRSYILRPRYFRKNDSLERIFVYRRYFVQIYACNLSEIKHAGTDFGDFIGNFNFSAGPLISKKHSVFNDKVLGDLRKRLCFRICLKVSVAYGGAEQVEYRFSEKFIIDFIGISVEVD